MTLRTRSLLGLGGLLCVASLAATPSTALASAAGNNRDVYIGVNGTRIHVDSIEAHSWNHDYVDHFAVWDSTANWHVNEVPWAYDGESRMLMQVNRDFPAGSLVCVEGWKRVGAQWVSTGRPCEEIKP